VTPARDRANLQRLARAFEEIDAGLYTADDSGTWCPRVPVENWAPGTPGRTRLCDSTRRELLAFGCCSTTSKR
jgi:hypothetical protein